MGMMIKAGYDTSFGWGDSKTQEFFAMWNAAKSGNARAQYRLSKAFEVGEHGALEDRKRAREWLDESAKSGLCIAEYELGMREIEGKNWGGKPDFGAGMKWLSHAKQHGHRKSFELYKEAREKAIGKSKEFLVQSLKAITGCECEKNIGEGIALVRKANKEIHQRPGKYGNGACGSRFRHHQGKRIKSQTADYLGTKVLLCLVK